MDTNIVYYSKRSPFKVKLTDFDGGVFTAARMATISKVLLRYSPSKGAAAEYADSELLAHAGIFDWATYATSGELLINLGLHAFSEGRDEEVEIAVYDTTYPEGRVSAVIDLKISYEMSGDYEGVAVLSKALGISALPPLAIDGDYSVVAADFQRPALQANFLTEGTILLPLITEALDGGVLSVDVCNIGDVVLLCSGSNKILNSSHASVKGVNRYSTVSIRANYALGMYVFACYPTGSWEGQ